MPQELYSGYGSVARLGPVVRKARPECVFLVFDKGAFAKSGAERAADRALDGIRRVGFSDYVVNPRIEDITRGVELLRTEDCDMVIGVGGGSAMDTAKSVSLLAVQDSEPVAIVRGGIEPRPRQAALVMVPTTAGTGSESTHFSVVYIGAEKYSLAHPSMLADTVILDPALTESMPPYLAACTGMDAVCQAIESWWSVNSTAESREYSRQSLALGIPNLEKAVTDPDRGARECMLLASNLAGRAINIARTTVAHAVSYPITSLFGVPHGHAVALTLPWFFEFNDRVDDDSVQDRRGVEHVRLVLSEILEALGVGSAREARRLIVDLARRIGLAANLSDVGIGRDDIDAIVRHGLSPHRAENNPRRVSAEDLREILERISDGADLDG